MSPTPSPPAEDPQQFLTRTDVAALLRISERTVDRYVRQGLLPIPTRFSRKAVRWHRLSLLSWLQQHGRLPPWLAELPRKELFASNPVAGDVVKRPSSPG